jgi:hypothetical protein
MTTYQLNQSESRLTQSENKTSDEVDGNRPVSDNVVYMEIETDKSSSPLHHVIRKPSLISANVWNIPASTEGHMKICFSVCLRWLWSIW